jgi:hypothetical protein
MKRITPLLIALMLFGTFATSTGCIVRTRDRHHHYNSGRRGPPPKAKPHDHRGRGRGHDKRDNRCRWERC